MNDSLRRAVRTFAQAFLGVIILQIGTIQADADDGKLDFEWWKRLLLSAAVAGFIALVTWAWNALENTTGKEFPVSK